MIEKLESFLEWGGIKKNVVLLVVSAVGVMLSLLKVSLFDIDPAWIAIILCGIPIVLEAIIGLVTEFDITADVLVALALISSLLIGETFAAGEVAFIMQLGALLEDLTVARARAGIEKLIHLTPRTARIIDDGAERIVPAEDVKIDQVIRVLPGETVPVDGIIISGNTSIDQAVMTGESLPVDKTVGDEVSSGTVNQFGSFDMKATKVGEDSSIQRMIRLVQSADADKAKIVTLADKWAVWVVIIALSAAILTYLITKEPIRAVTILVVFCPCSLVLATPTAIMAGIGNVTKHGFLVKEGDALERLSKVTIITFDKTGTLTYGKPIVNHIENHSNLPDEEFYKLIASTELRSEHPLGKAIVSGYRNQFKGMIPEPDSFEMIPGKGVIANVSNNTVLVGNAELLADNEILVGDKQITIYYDEGNTIIFVSINGKYAGFIALADELREDAKETILKVKKTGVIPVLLTGDHENAAKHIAGQLEISEYMAECLPEDKLNYITDQYTHGVNVCMIGDGINDAPALKKAYVGIAMGGVGSDIAVDAADIALINDDIKELPHLLELSKHMMNVIKVNLTFSMTLNFIAITLAITGILNPVIGALVHNAGSVLVISNSALLLGWRKK